MKHLTLIFAVFALFAGCAIEPNHQERQAVRKYLESKDIQVKEELFWGAPDSVFSSFNIDLSRDVTVTSLRNQIDNLYFENSFNRFNSKEYRIISDSIDRLNKKVKEIDEAVKLAKEEQRKNRVGIEFSYIDGNDRTCDLIFVFNHDGKSIGHVTLSSGTFIELY